MFFVVSIWVQLENLETWKLANLKTCKLENYPTNKYAILIGNGKEESS